MEDVTDTVFRRIVLSCARPAVFFTEFTSVDGLFSAGREAVIHRLRFTQEEKPLVAQVWGNTPENYRKAGELLRELNFDGLDINMGCPVPKIVKNGACSALIENRSLAKEIILAAKEGAGGLPVSVKTRIGFRKRATEEWAAFLLELQPDVLTVHPRLAKDMSRVPADWAEVAKVVQLRDRMKSPALILGNGDITSPEDLKSKIEFSGADGAMVGRGIFHDPFIFAGRRVALDSRQRLQLLLRHARLFAEVWGAERDFAVMKKFFKIYAAGFRGAPALRADLMKCETLDDVEAIIAAWPAGSIQAFSGRVEEDFCCMRKT